MAIVETRNRGEFRRRLGVVPELLREDLNLITMTTNSEGGGYGLFVPRNLMYGEFVEYFTDPDGLLAHIGARFRRARTFERGDEIGTRKLTKAEINWRKSARGPEVVLSGVAKSPYNEQTIREQGLQLPDRPNDFSISFREGGEDKATARYQDIVGFRPSVDISLANTRQLTLLASLGDKDVWDVMLDGHPVTYNFDDGYGTRSVRRDIKLDHEVPVKMGLRVGVFQAGSSFEVAVHGISEDITLKIPRTIDRERAIAQLKGSYVGAAEYLKTQAVDYEQKTKGF